MNIPEPIRRLDAGAELIRTKRNGDTIWHVVVSSPSGIEQDRAYVYERRTQRARHGDETRWANHDMSFEQARQMLEALHPILYGEAVA